MEKLPLKNTETPESLEKKIGINREVYNLVSERIKEAKEDGESLEKIDSLQKAKSIPLENIQKYTDLLENHPDYKKKTLKEKIALHKEQEKLRLQNKTQEIPGESSEEEPQHYQEAA
jgi:hypothetical protein